MRIRKLHPHWAESIDLHDQRQNPDTVSAIVQYDGWNLNFESSVLSIRDDKPSVFFEGTEGTLDLSRDGYTFTPNQGEACQGIFSREPGESAHAELSRRRRSAKPLNAPLKAGIDASLPVQMALRSYWSHKMVSQAQLA